MTAKTKAEPRNGNFDIYSIDLNTPGGIAALRGSSAAAVGANEKAKDLVEVWQPERTLVPPREAVIAPEWKDPMDSWRAILWVFCARIFYPNFSSFSQP